MSSHSTWPIAARSAWAAAFWAGVTSGLAAALDVLMREPGLAALMREAVAAAKRRAEELSG